MKISNGSEPLRPDRLQPQASEPRAAAAKGASPASESERVQLSPMASRMAELENRFGGEFDARKVEQVRAAIAEGRFRVNAEVVADKLLASVGELLGRKA
jgi:negative regulator of flagellin synthesis FlgM